MCKYTSYLFYFYVPMQGKRKRKNSIHVSYSWDLWWFANYKFYCLDLKRHSGAEPSIVRSPRPHLLPSCKICSRNVRLPQYFCRPKGQAKSSQTVSCFSWKFAGSNNRVQVSFRTLIPLTSWTVGWAWLFPICWMRDNHTFISSCLSKKGFLSSLVSRCFCRVKD